MEYWTELSTCKFFKAGLKSGLFYALTPFKKSYYKVKG